MYLLEEQRTEAGPMAAAGGAGATKARILIADDDGQIRAMLHELLCGDYECVEVSSAEEALALLVEREFDLILSDIQMGGLSGIEMLPRVSEVAPDAVVIMVSGGQTVEGAIRALREGAFDYVTKPFDLDHVEAAVRRALEHRQLRAAKRYYENHLEELVRQRTAERDHLAYHDALTGLPKRAIFEDRLAQALGAARRRGERPAVASVALDRFKKYNDTLGHAAGDRLLAAVAERLRACAREGDTVSRFEGDEFTLLLTSVGHAGDAAAAEEIGRVLREPFRVDGHELYVTASVGVALYPRDGDDAQSLLKNAGAALFRAKQQGGNQCQCYTADMNEHAVKRLSLENSLRRALDGDEFTIHYQPKVAGDTGEVVGAEALVRWRHPEMGLISPAEFIPLAEDTGMIVPLGEWVLRGALQQAAAWKAAGLEPFCVSVNLSPRQFQQPDLLDVVGRELGEAHLDAACLELEVTESSVMRDGEAAIATLHELKEMGVRVAVDDFGSGYSSLAYLKHLPVDVLKIDKSFVSDMTDDPNDAAIVMAIITLAHSLKLEVVAEGVETEEQLRFLRLLRCDAMQGYLFSKPVPAAEFERLLRGGARGGGPSPRGSAGRT